MPNNDNGYFEKLIRELINQKDLNRISGKDGCLLIADTAEHIVRHESFVVQEDGTGFTTLTGVNDLGVAVDFKTTLGISASTLKKGALITVPMGYYITLIDLTAGSVIMY